MAKWSEAVEAKKAELVRLLEDLDGRPYVMLVVDQPLPIGVPVTVSGPVYWLHSNMTVESVVRIMRSVASRAEETKEDESIERSSN